MLTLLLLLSTAQAGDVPDFVPPDATLLAALPAEQREMLLSAQIADNTDPVGEERLLVALMVSQRFGAATSADTPELLPTLTDALSDDPNTRGEALARAGTKQASPIASAPSAELSRAEGIQVSTAPRNAVLRSATGRKLPQEWRYLNLERVPSPPADGGVAQTWVVTGRNGRTADALDLARVLQLREHEEVLMERRKRTLLNAGVGAGVAGVGFVVGSSVMWFAPVIGIALVGAGVAGAGAAGMSPLIWKRQKYQYDRWFQRDDLLKRIEAHNLYWSSQVSPSSQHSGRPALPPVYDTVEPAAPPPSPAAPEPAAPPAEAEPPVGADVPEEPPPAPKPPR